MGSLSNYCLHFFLFRERCMYVVLIASYHHRTSKRKGKLNQKYNTSKQVREQVTRITFRLLPQRFCETIVCIFFCFERAVCVMIGSVLPPITIRLLRGKENLTKNTTQEKE